MNQPNLFVKSKPEPLNYRQAFAAMHPDKPYAVKPGDGGVHPNSREAYRTLDLSDRQRAVIDALRSIGGPATDRQVVEKMGSGDMNAARPRLTELVDAGVLVEVDSVPCAVTGRKVRRVWFAGLDNASAAR